MLTQRLAEFVVDTNANMDCAGLVLGESGAGELLELLQRCETLSGIGSLMKATVPSWKLRASCYARS